MRLFLWHQLPKIAPAILIGMIGLSDMAWSQQLSSGEELSSAAIGGDIAVLKRLIAAGAPLDPVDGAKQTPLLIAVERNQFEAAILLIEAGANINALAENLDTPWLLAGALGRTEMLRRMIPKGPDLTLRNRYGGSALIPACERGHVETVKLLLTTSIDVDQINNLGWTCLLEIVILGDGGPRHVAVTKLVLAADADPNIADNAGVTPLAHARNRGQREVAAMIESAGGR